MSTPGCHSHSRVYRVRTTGDGPALADCPRLLERTRAALAEVGYGTVIQRWRQALKRAVLPMVVVGILAVLAILLVIGLTVDDKTGQELEEDRQDGAPALAVRDESVVVIATAT